MSEKVVHIGSDQWEKEVLNGGNVIVDFYSTECPPCEALAAKFEPLSKLYGDYIKFVKIFRQENRDLATKLSVSGSPTILFYKDGKEVGERLTGAIKRSKIIEELNKLISENQIKEINAKLEKKETECDVLILGAGPAGLTAGIYAAQAHLDTIIVDKGLTGGQVTTTHLVSNFPGFEEPQQGFMLMHYMDRQAAENGVNYRLAVEPTRIDLENKEVEIDGLETIKAKKIIIATGSSPNEIGIPGEKELKGKGISYCATCDAKYFEDKKVIVVGGGNSAIEESLFISKFASKIKIIHQFDDLQANKVAQERIFKLRDEGQVEFMFSHEPREFIKNDDGTMTVKAENLKTKEIVETSADGVFVFIGMKPNIDGLNGLKLDDFGYIETDNLQRTNIKDVFAAGDVANKRYRQITVATAEGTVAAIQASVELS